MRRIVIVIAMLASVAGVGYIWSRPAGADMTWRCADGSTRRAPPGDPPCATPSGLVAPLPKPATILSTAHEARVDALDLALAPAAHAGRKLRVTGCTLWGARVDGIVHCAITRRGGEAGHIPVAVAPEDAGGLRKAIEHCAGLAPPATGCRVEINGLAGTLDGRAAITGAVLLWQE